MGKRTGSNIILIGFSATGKSKVGRKVAQLLDWDFLDTDDEIVRLAGKSIPRISAEDGEPHFRELERQVLEQAGSRERTVIATGGGAVLSSHNQEVMARSGMVVCLEAKAETIRDRLRQDNETSGPLRPLLATPDPLQRIKELKQARQPCYAIADWTVHTDYLNIPEVCQEVARGWYRWRQARREEIAMAVPDNLAAEVITATQVCPAFVGWGLMQHLGDRMRCAGLSGAAYIVTDETVFPLYGLRVKESLEKAGFRTALFMVPAGEKSKTLDRASALYDWLVGHKSERRDMIVALGGGVVGDLAGFVAATFLRGMPLVQVPTSLIAMVDAAVGGKTAVNHPQAKNIIGAFYQPHLILADVAALATLPRRELVSGWAEVIKHGLILDSRLFEFIERNLDGLTRLDPDLTTEAIRRSVAIKAQVASEDEKEQGKRTLLNYGHTIGHALETATGYERLLHGEAVAVGMMGAARIGQQLGLLSPEVVARQQSLLQRFGLPTTCSGVDSVALLRAMELDKKVRGKAIRWVLLEGLGQAIIRDDIPQQIVLNAIESLLIKHRTQEGD